MFFYPLLLTNIRKAPIALMICMAFLPTIQSQDTFSIVAIDTLTGEIGSAGASCLDNNQFPGSGGAFIISDVLPGRGAIHTQSYWHATNQANARLRMQEGYSPQEILDWLKSNDPTGPFGAQTRQYGIVDFDPQGQPRSAAFTGNGCQDWKGHRTGTTYAIQGNILLGPAILDSMESRFLQTNGTLADRLMAALQGANVPGADTRCLNNGTSSLSAFLRVAKPADDEDNLYLDLNVPSLPAGQEPIDSLQSLYNLWLTTAASYPAPTDLRLFPNPASGSFTVECPAAGRLEIYDLQGRLTLQSPLLAGRNQLQPSLVPGVYLVHILQANQSVKQMKLFWY